MKGNLNFLLFLHFLNDGIRTSLVVLLPFIAKDLLLSYTEVGLAGSAQGLFTVLFALPAGFLASKIGGYRLLISALLIYSFGSLGIFTSPNSNTLIFTFYLAAVGFGLFHTVGFSLVAKESDKTNVGMNMANFTSIGDIGRIALSSIALFLTTFIGWRLTTICLGLTGLITFAAAKIFIIKKEKYNITNSSGESHTAWLKNFFVILKTKKLLLISLATLFDAFASNQLFIFIPFIIVARGVDAARLSLFTGGYFIGNFVGKTILGRSVDKYGNKKVFIFSEISMAFVIILFIVSNNFLLLFIFSFLLGIFTKGTSPVVQTMFSDSTHEAHYEKVYAISEVFIGTASSLSPVIMGLFADRFGINSVFYISATFALTAIIPIIFLSRTKTHQYLPQTAESKF